MADLEPVDSYKLRDYRGIKESNSFKRIQYLKLLTILVLWTKANEFFRFLNSFIYKTKKFPSAVHDKLCSFLISYNNINYYKPL